jgi:hypothetical protein
VLAEVHLDRRLRGKLELLLTRLEELPKRLAVREP